MKPMKLFLDTHDRRHGTFPEGITAEGFASFYPKYEAACREVGAVSLRVHVGLAEGRAFCLTMAESAEVVRRAHEKVGLLQRGKVSAAVGLVLRTAGKGACDGRPAHLDGDLPGARHRRGGGERLRARRARGHRPRRGARVLLGHARRRPALHAGPH